MQNIQITHPYGKDKSETDEMKVEIRYVEDIGAGQVLCSAALKSRIGTFLKWDPAVGPQAPAGYIGDPDVDHNN